MARGKHPGNQDWIDLARGLESGAHLLDQLDADTRHRVQRFAQFHEFAKQESANRPPEPLLRKVQALASRLPAVKPGRFRTILAALTFNSAAQPALAGVRSVEMGVRQLVFEAGGFDILLRAEPAAVQGACVIVGQVLDRERTKQSPGRLPVRLLRGKNEVAATTTNEAGEFHFEDVDLSGMVLEVLMETKGISLQVPLGTMLEDGQ